SSHHTLPNPRGRAQANQPKEVDCCAWNPPSADGAHRRQPQRGKPSGLRASVIVQPSWWFPCNRSFRKQAVPRSIRSTKFVALGICACFGTKHGASVTGFPAKRAPWTHLLSTPC